jgi:hypothetical protein
VAEGAGNGRGLFHIQIGDLVDECQHRHLVRFFRHEAEIPQPVDGFLKVGQRCRMNSRLDVCLNTWGIHGTHSFPLFCLGSA